jgi:hypothetical protein
MSHQHRDIIQGDAPAGSLAVLQQHDHRIQIGHGFEKMDVRQFQLVGGPVAGEFAQRDVTERHPGFGEALADEGEFCVFGSFDVSSAKFEREAADAVFFTRRDAFEGEEAVAVGFRERDLRGIFMQRELMRRFDAFERFGFSKLQRTCGRNSTGMRLRPVSD